MTTIGDFPHVVSVTLQDLNGSVKAPTSKTSSGPFATMGPECIFADHPEFDHISRTNSFGDMSETGKWFARYDHEIGAFLYHFRELDDAILFKLGLS